MPFGYWFGLLVLFVFTEIGVGIAPAEAEWTPPPCLFEAASTYGVNAEILMAIVLAESSGDPLALSENRQGKGIAHRVASHAEAVRRIRRLWEAGADFDVGLGQINVRTIEPFGVNPLALLDPCVNLHWAAYVLRSKIARHGNTWTAIERYNGINPDYPWAVYRRWQRLDADSVPR